MCHSWCNQWIASSISTMSATATLSGRCCDCSRGQTLGRSPETSSLGRSLLPYHLYNRHISGPTPAKVLITLALFIGQISDVYSWSVSNLLITGSQASILNTDTVNVGVQTGLNECARQFSFERWPCPATTFTEKNIFRISLPINREIAFVQAIISAGLAHTATRECSSGQTENCQCSNTYQNQEAAAKNGFRWAGCSDNIEHGSKSAKVYLDKFKLSGHDLNAQIRRHNTEAGLNAIKETMLRICKCHGVSGSCSTQTCWTRINEFSEVGNYLKKAYRKAAKLENNENTEKSMEKSLATAAKWKLVYMHESPDYCLASNSSLESPGTLGRKCSVRTGKDVSSEERNSCRRLCKKCGYAVKIERRVVNSRCNCKFKFCCEVQCEQCTKEEFTNVCVTK